ncbi:Carbohydrate-binding module family 1 protein [Coniochaeta hoffmannii]|uniref:Carbohydrate-binding module family 1 protein n=1 Tax=Coniochaeta hoffmannii TaxID=91930 RepID=A0AA38R3J7_9PEZI|nr:Carbohydrate-binding module family 1 protein [Coniochaeta hoffmannii]
MLPRLSLALAAGSLWLQTCAAQTVSNYTDKATGIQFGTWGFLPNASDPDSIPASAAFTFGMALPGDALDKDASEYIGILRCSKVSATATGWCGISHGQSGQMTQALLLVAWPYGNQIMTSFRYTPGYQFPPVYKGDAKLTQISSFVNDTTYELIYRCQNCFTWSASGANVSVQTSQKFFVLGRAAASKAVTNPGCPDKVSFAFHDNGYGQFGADLSVAVQPSYSSWTALATKAVTPDCGAATSSPTAAPTSSATGNGTATATATGSGSAVPTSSATATATATGACAPVATGAAAKTYEYIIVGAGAGGIPLADRLTAAGHSVLLIEKGPPSSGRYGGTMKPEWLEGTNLTRFDVPGLCNQIWHDSTGIACEDTDQMAGCVLGGGTAVNAGLWWKPSPKDWDYNFPAGWKSSDLAGATTRAFNRIPGTTTPSLDGKLYRQEGFNVLASGFNQSGWQYIVPNDHPDQKNHTYGHTTYMFDHGERGGPLATYLASALARKNLFTLWTDTAVKRIVRVGGHAVGVETECYGGNGHAGQVNVTPLYGRVIVSAGTFGSAKLLMRSGIGPADQLAVVKASSDGATMVGSDDWIDLPVGYNLVDHVNTDTIITHPDVVFYDFYEAWDTPNPSDESAYLGNRTGILTQAAPNIGPMFWDEIKGPDGIVRQLQWTARVEGNDAFTTSKNAMTMSQYLGRGSVSRGRMTITPALDTVVTTAPYLHDDFDKQAVIQGIKNLQAALSGIQNLTWILPRPNQTVEDFVNTMDVSPATRRANHWMGTAKLGYDDGRTGGSAVVDANLKVYGTDNIFVVDASVFPGQPTGNPSAMIVILAEQASTRLLSLAYPRALNLGAQCGGAKYTGSSTCGTGLECRALDKTYSICAQASTTKLLH